MGKSDDSISRRRNKKSLKKQENKRNPSSQVSARIAAIIAAKKRRQTGKRSMCQSMCFSLPTPQDPFNDRQGKSEPTRKRKRDSKTNKSLKDRKDSHRSKKESHDARKQHLQEENGKPSSVSSPSFMGPEIAINVGKPTCQIIKWDGHDNSWKELGSVTNTESPSKYVIMCLNSIQDALNSETDKPLFASVWGLDFWNCYCTGKDVLETNVADSTVEQIAWIASTAADNISMKEKEGTSFGGPFLLYLVPSQDKASKVRQICKPLKERGVHTVSLHSGASIANFFSIPEPFHNLFGRVTCDSLKSCEPEFLVSTPERLLELLSLKAVDISAVSLLIVDGLEVPFKGIYFDAVKSIRRFISGNPQSVVFCDCINNSSISVVQKLLGGTGLQTVQQLLHR
ncbi:hypothetical protein PHJA_002179300 [Phtheirospermum japonicum]|uniref:DEAD/DEAH box helicase domain-containing protein n=1 Tax=Phtheirospermum japonicum TaxID=374723 RepID=A0A830CQ52_9LAMI|nr:hypothetical protein PHJA_002179300 [Phtheirospermum japonicum]